MERKIVAVIDHKEFTVVGNVQLYLVSFGAHYYG